MPDSALCPLTAGRQRRHRLGLLAAAVCVSVVSLLAAQGAAWACSCGGVATALVWPEAGEPLPANARAVFATTGHRPERLSLATAGGQTIPAMVEATDHSPGSVCTTTYWFVDPTEDLEPGSTVTLTAHYPGSPGGEDFQREVEPHQVHQELEVTNPKVVTPPEPPHLLTYFASGPRHYLSACDDVAHDARGTFVEVEVAEEGMPVLLRLESDDPSLHHRGAYWLRSPWFTDYGRTFYLRGYHDGSPTCLTVTLEDVYGNRVSSSERCEPDFCPAWDETAFTQNDFPRTPCATDEPTCAAVQRHRTLPPSGGFLPSGLALLALALWRRR